MLRQVKKLTREQYDNLVKELDRANIVVDNNKALRMLVIQKNGLVKTQNNRFVVLRNKNGGFSLNHNQLELVKEYGLRYDGNYKLNFIEFEV